MATPTGLPVLEILESGIALIRLGTEDERVVTITMERMRGLAAILEQLERKQPKGVVITGPGPEMFTAGADIRLIRDVVDPAIGEKLAREGQLVFDRIERLSCPTVAAISGPCVGGGCELVLACSVRIMTPEKSSVIGLPEIKLGILPGFGGTQRLPRLIGLPAALDIILAGKTVRPDRAKRIGLVHEVVPYRDLLKRAEAIALGSSSRRASAGLVDKLLTWTGPGRRLVRKRAEKSVRKQTKGLYPAPPAALHAACLGLAEGQEAGLQHEARELGRLIVTPESKSLVRLFFLTESAKELGKSARQTLHNLHALVVGAGAMGAGIAQALARAEFPVILRDSTPQGLERGLTYIRESLQKSRSLTDAERSFIMNRIEGATQDTPSLSAVNFVIEAIFEDLELKKKVLSGLASLIPARAVIATNTSSLSVSTLGEALPEPGRTIGMHFFNPVDKMPLVEIIRGRRSDDATVAIVAALTVKLGKFPIVVQDVPGFLVNRILVPYLNEAAYLLSEGYAVADIDRTALSFGMPMGPIRLLDEVGLDVAAHVQEIMLAGYGERMRGPDFAAKLVAAGRKGKKNGGGFYDFSSDRELPWAALSQTLAIAPRKDQADQALIRDRLILSLVNEAVRCLDEGVAGRAGPEAASQIDLGSVMGFGFPPCRGGVLWYAESVGAKAVESRLTELSRLVGGRFEAAPGITARAKQGGSFLNKI